MRSNAHQGEFLGLINFGSGLATLRSSGCSYTGGELPVHTTNPVPHTYLRGIGAMSLEGIQKIHPRIQARGFCGTGQTGLCCGLMCISEDFLD